MDCWVNPTEGDTFFYTVRNSEYFVDKSGIISECFSRFNSVEQHRYISRPRRFGKSYVAAMLSSFFSVEDTSDSFEQLVVASHPQYAEFRSQFNVLYLNLEMADFGGPSFVDRVRGLITRSLRAAFPVIDFDADMELSECLTLVYLKTRKKFVIVVDEWDSFFQGGHSTSEERVEYLSFLRSILKNKRYAAFVYMTGVLPLLTYSPGSALNVFRERNFDSDLEYDQYFGFTVDEVDDLHRRYLEKEVHPKITRRDLDEWYNGYITATGLRIYNPDSIVQALTSNRLGQYWPRTGMGNEVYKLSSQNVDSVRDDIAMLIDGKSVPVNVVPHRVFDHDLSTRDGILTAMIFYGQLTEESGKVRIPNFEIRQQFVSAVYDRPEFGALHEWGTMSHQLLKALWALDAMHVADLIQRAHDLRSPIRDYSHELELAHVMDFLFMGLRGRYIVHREAPAGHGFADFILTPRADLNDPCIVVELKKDVSPQAAVEQIKSRGYQHVFDRDSRLTGPVLGVGISFNSKDPSKPHGCVIEVLRGKA